MSEQPVLLPLGWPHVPQERSALVRLLHACRGSLERIIDEPHDSFAAFVRHVSRLTLARSPREVPLVAVVARSMSPTEVMRVCKAMRGASPEFERATLLIYLAHEERETFLLQLEEVGCHLDFGGNLVIWRQDDLALAVVDADTRLVDLQERLTDLVGAPSHSSAPAPGPSSDPESFPPSETRPLAVDRAPESQVLSTRPSQRTLPFVGSVEPTPQSEEIPRRSSMPPNPRLRRP